MALLRAEALFDFEPTASVELELKRGDVVMVRRTSVGEGWWEGELNGKRGLFPSSFVKVLPVSQGSPSKERPVTPITPRTSKKMFMDALLAPATLTQEPLYDRDKAADIFTPGHADISITVGPAWDCDPPSLTVAIRHMQSESRFSGMKHTMVYEVETEQLGTRVARRYRHFLWLYDKMAELFPCLSLPPLPVKHFSGLSALEGNEARRRGLEKFLVRVARHPVLASTKLFHEFLTAKKDEKEWKIGRHLSKVLKSKKMFSSPFFYAVKYPPFNVPVHQLSSIEKFSRFSRFMETTVHTFQQTCCQLTTMNSDAVTCVCMLGRDFQRFSSGKQPASGGWILVQKRKHAAAAPSLSVNGPSPLHVTSVTHQKAAVPADVDDYSSDEEKAFDVDAQWNWREDKRFAQMTENLHDLGGRMRKFKPFLHAHQESMDRQVKDTLDDYSSIIHTLPMLVKLHEEAMEVFNLSRDKESKKDAEETRQHCDTLNNILLAEFDYFSKTMIDDFEVMTARLLKQQADFHRRLADELEALYRHYTTRTSMAQDKEEEDRNSFFRSRSTSCSKKDSSLLKSGSVELTSSQESASSEPCQRTPTKEKLFEASQTSVTSQTSVQTLTTGGMPNYINVEIKSRRTESSGSEIDEDILKPPGERGATNVTVTTMKEFSPPPPSVESIFHTEVELAPTPFDDPFLDDNTLTEQDGNTDDLPSPMGSDESDERELSSSFPNYANLEFAQVNNLLSQVLKPLGMAGMIEESSVAKTPKKPMPIQRKTKSSAALLGGANDAEKMKTEEEKEEEKEEEGKLEATSSLSGSPVKSPVPKKPAPPVKPPNLLNQESGSPVHTSKFQRKPSPISTAAASTASNSTTTTKPAASNLPALSKFLASNSETRVKDDVIVGATAAPPSVTKPRSHTTAVLPSSSSSTSISSVERKQPILPPAARYGSKSRSPSPEISPVSVQPQSSLTFSRDKSTENEPAVVANTAPVCQKKPVLKTQVSEPGLVKSRPIAAAPPPTYSKAVKPTYNTYGGRFQRTFGGGATTSGSNHTSSSNNSSNSELDELMKKLTLRRQRIDEQLSVTKSSGTSHATSSTKTSSPVPKTSPPSVSPIVAHRASVPLSHKSSTTISSSSIRSGEVPSERNSTISTSSSEVIVAYRNLDKSPSMTSLSSNGTSYSLEGGGGGPPVLLRKPEEAIETNLSKYGIIEEGGSYVI